MIKQWIIKIKIKAAIMLLKSVQIYYNEYVNDSQMCYNKKKNIDFLYAELNKMCYNVGGKVENGKEGVISMLTIFDIANWFLSKESMTHKKLQKLCYYAQAWSLALRNQPICDAEFEAWVHGPVCRALYNKYSFQGWVPIEQIIDFDLEIDENVVDLLERVYETYKDFDGDQLEIMTHREAPWLNQRAGLKPWESSENIIRAQDMRDYYLKLYRDEQND